VSCSFVFADAAKQVHKVGGGAPSNIGNYLPASWVSSVIVCWSFRETAP
jgi:hypothetical protein